MEYLVYFTIIPPAGKLEWNKNDRYLTDIFYIHDEDDLQRIAEEGIFLNQELLDKGLVRMF